MTLSILGQLDRDGLKVIRWDDATLYKTVLAKRGHIRRWVMLLTRVGWTLSKIERWDGCGRGIACFLTFTKEGV